MPTSLEIDEARARWRELASGNAGLGPIAAFHDERLAGIAERPAPDVAVDLTSANAALAIREGRPLLEAGGLQLDPDEVLAELRIVARDLAETAEPGPAQRTAERLATLPLDLGPLLGAALEGGRDATVREAERHDLDAEAFARLLDLALQPSLWEAAAQLAALADLDAWDRGYCPVCAAWPVLAELVGPEKRRVLRCVRCGTAWSWLVLLCPYCGNDDHRSLGALQEAGGSKRIDVCERCHGYVKAVSAYTSASAVRLIAEDVATLDLDVAATSAGYRRPGDVDVATAGIPRLVREGRALPSRDRSP